MISNWNGVCTLYLCTLFPKVIMWSRDGDHQVHHVIALVYLHFSFSTSCNTLCPGPARHYAVAQILFTKKALWLFWLNHTLWKKNSRPKVHRGMKCLFQGAIWWSLLPLWETSLSEHSQSLFLLHCYCSLLNSVCSQHSMRDVTAASALCANTSYTQISGSDFCLWSSHKPLPLLPPTEILNFKSWLFWSSGEEQQLNRLFWSRAGCRATPWRRRVSRKSGGKSPCVKPSAVVQVVGGFVFVFVSAYRARFPLLSHLCLRIRKLTVDLYSAVSIYSSKSQNL